MYYLAPYERRGGPGLRGATQLRGSWRPSGAYQLQLSPRIGLLWLDDDHETRGLLKIAEHPSDVSRVASAILGSRRPLGEAVAGILLEQGLRPTPERWEVWCGPRPTSELWTRDRLWKRDPERCRVIVRDFRAHRLDGLRRVVREYGLRAAVVGLSLTGAIDLRLEDAAILLALPFSDAFTNSDSTNLTTHNAGWSYTGASAGFSIVSNRLRTAGGVANGYHARWTGDTWPDDQYAQADAVDNANNNTQSQLGPAVRLQGTLNGYVLRVIDVTTNGISFIKYLNDAANPQWGAYNMPTLPVTYRIQAIGSSIRVLRDGTLDTGLATNPATDTAFTTGSAGIFGYENRTQPKIDNFEGGEAVAASGGQSPRAMHHYRSRRV